MARLYFSGPLFSAAEKKFNLDLCRKIEAIGYSVFLPQRDGPEHDQKLTASLNREEQQESIFVVDRMRVLECDFFLLILDGRVPDEGACVELGMVYAQKYLTNADKTILGLNTDPRFLFPDSKLNPMIQRAMDRIFESEESLLDYLRKLPK
ncbi:MAG: nucleoside 2-deoxyribosyltransferase [Spirochaetia bacterium]|nr:nucleoside 2-deoxyribosyltransferase [Spirochaetia bacterium]